MNRACSNQTKCHTPQCDCPRITGEITVSKTTLVDVALIAVTALISAVALFTIAFFLFHWATA